MTFTTARRDLARHQKTAKGAPPYSRFVNRPLGRVLAAAASITSASPNQITMTSAACSAAGIALIATVDPSALSALVVVGLLILGYGLDSADGQLARLRGGGSPGGEGSTTPSTQPRSSRCISLSSFRSIGLATSRPTFGCSCRLASPRPRRCCSSRGSCATTCSRTRRSRPTAAPTENDSL